MSLTYGSVCSGIEAASVAWHPLGLKPTWFAEIEDFPSAVLAHHWPEVRNLGDMTQIAAMILAGEVEAPDVLVGGTPCQGFSVAGLRGGLKDPRGQLTLAFVELANAIDKKRAEEGKEPCIVVWENVPGVLSMPDNAFGNFFAGLAGSDDAIEPGARPQPGKNSKFWRWSKSTSKHVAKWPHAGGAFGQQRAVGWRLLDAQYFGLAQRRRRIFVVASARNGFDPIAVLSEFDGVRRDTAPSRSAGQNVTASAQAGAGAGGEGTGNNGSVSHWDDATHPHPTLSQSNSTSGIGQSNQELFAQRGAGLVGCMAHGQSGAETRLDNSAPTLTCNHEAPIVFNEIGFAKYIEDDVCGTIRCGNKMGGGVARESTLLTFPAQMSGTQFHSSDEDVCQTLQAHNPTAVCYDAMSVALRGRDGGTTAELGEKVATALRSAEGGAGKAHVLIQPYRYGEHQQDTLHDSGGIMSTLPAGTNLNGAQYTTTVTPKMEIRRLLPLECERLQGFPDHYTFIPLNKRKKVTLDEMAWLRHHFPDMPEDELIRAAADGPRYKALGNSMAVPVMRWIMKRITGHLVRNFAELVTKVTGLVPLLPHQAEVLNDIVFTSEHCTLRIHPSGGATLTGLAAPAATITVDPAAYITSTSDVVEVTEKELEVTAPPLTSKKKTMPKKPKKQKVIAPSFVRPFLKWPGGKYSVLAQVLPHLGEGNRLIEPFAGSGVVSMNAPQFDRYLLADTNRDLIGLYIGAGVANIIDLARPLFRDMNSRGDYETLRAKFNSNKMGMAERAATFLYINRHSFNGLIRYNLAGRINSPFGYYKAPYFPFDELTAFKEQYSRYEFKCQSFVDTIREARAGDVVFCDPPYMPLPDKEGFTSYTKDPFTDEHHWQLLNEMVQAAQRGARVVVTNSGAPSLHENYTKQGFKIYPLYARRSMSCKGGTRGVAADIIGVLDIE